MNPSGPYEDILYLPRPESKRYAKMRMIDRGAQFSPFAALTGYDTAIAETARLTEQPLELDESQKQVLNRQIRLLAEHENPTVRISWFCPDERKSGGAFQTITGQIRRISAYEQAIYLTDGTAVLFDSICSLEGIDVDLDV